MRIKAVLYAIGRLLQIMGGVMLVPLGISIWDERHIEQADVFSRPVTLAFAAAIAASVLVGTLLAALCKSESNKQGVKEGFGIVTLGWVTLALMGSIPFMVWFATQEVVLTFGGALGGFTDAYFEIMSGFTTTGSTILTDIEILPRGLLFWRSLTHWLGGMGIITLALAIFPAMGVGGYQMFRGEVPGPSADRLRPRLRDTAAILWGVYALLSGLEVLLLLPRMNLFEALCHTFGTMATGGFSTRNASIGAYDSAYVDWVITLFMFLAGTNFLIHYRLIFKRDWTALRENREFHFYAGTVLIAIAVFTLILLLVGLPDYKESLAHHRHDQPTLPVHEEQIGEYKEWVDQHEAWVAREQAKVDSFGGALRRSAFQVVAIVTTTGYGTADFDVWPRVLGIALVVLMFWGGCAGSTGGGMKMIRVLVTLKASWRELKKVLRPRLVAPLKVRRLTVGEDMVSNIVGFFVLFVGLFVVCTVLMSFFIQDLTTAATSVVAAIANIGPGLSGVGSSQTYAWIEPGGKWVLILCMLLGRLEIFTVLVLFRASFWRR